MMMPTLHMLAGPAGLAESFFNLEHFFETLTADRISAGWIVFGMTAQFIMMGCLAAQWYVSRRHGRTVIRSGVIYVGLVATVMLLVYASIRHDLIFVVGQLLNVVIGLRLLDLIRRNGVKRTETDVEHFPRVEPESAERRCRAGREGRRGGHQCHAGGGVVPKAQSTRGTARQTAGPTD